MCQANCIKNSPPPFLQQLSIVISAEHPSFVILTEHPSFVISTEHPSFVISTEHPFFVISTEAKRNGEISTPIHIKKAKLYMLS